MALSGNTVFWVLWNPIEFKLPFFFSFLKNFPFLRFKPRLRRVKPFSFFFFRSYWQEPRYRNTPGSQAPAMEKCPEFQVLYLGSISTWALACRNRIHCSMDKFQELFPCVVNAKTGPSRLLLKCCCQAIKRLKSAELKGALCMHSPRCF